MRAATRGSWRWRLPRRLASPGGSVTRVVERSFPGRATPSTRPAYPSRTPHRGRLAGVSEPWTADIASGAAKDDRPGIETRRTSQMKGLKLSAVTLLGVVALLASAAPASARAGAYKHYVACGLAAKAKPSHVCPRKGSKGAFFRSNKADVFYTICVK